MGYVAKLKHGSRTLDIANGRYAIDEGAVPPSAQITVNYASGSSANRLGGSSRISDRAENRTWTFGLHIKGDSMGEIRRAVDDLSAFLSWAGDDDDPLFLQWNERDSVPVPVWGQDGTLFYEIVDGRVDLPYGSHYYSNAATGSAGLPYCTVVLTIKPYAFGLPQVAAQAKGCIHHETVGATDGRDRGVVVSHNTTNKFTNPVFGHPTWNTGWNASGALRATENTDPRFVVEGITSPKLEAFSGYQSWSQSLTLTVSTYTVSFYAKRPDGGAVTQSTCFVLFNGSGLSSSFVSVGDGWYRVYATSTGTAVSGTYGVGVDATVGTQVVYVDGFQVEESVFTTPLCHGDMYGCAWSGTAHASTTTRTAPYLRIPLDGKNFSTARGSIRTVISTRDLGFGGYLVLWQEAATSIRAYYDVSLTRWFLHDNTNSISYSTNLTAHTTYVIHTVWDNGRMQIYINGASVASGATFAPAATAPTYLYIGTTPTPNNHLNAVFGGTTIWAEALTTAQVLSDYTGIAPIVSDRQRAATTPYLWTQAGNGYVDIYDDNTYDNWAVFQGIPGSAPADVEYLISGNGGDTAIVGLWETREFIKPTRILYQDQGGTADAGSSGGSYRRTTPAASTETDINTSTVLWTSDHKLYRFVEDREWFALVRARIASGTGKLRQRLKIGGSTYITARQTVAAPVTYFRQVMAPPIHFPRLDTADFLYPSLSHYLTTKNSGAVNSDVDFYCLFPKRHVRFPAGSTLLRGKRWSAEYEFPAASFYSTAGINSNDLDLSPDTHNVMLVANDGGSYVSTDSGQAGMTFLRTKITPRYILV